MLSVYQSGYAYTQRVDMRISGYVVTSQLLTYPHLFSGVASKVVGYSAVISPDFLVTAILA